MIQLTAHPGKTRGSFFALVPMFCVLAFSMVARAATDLPAPVLRALNSAGIPPDHVGVVVQAVDSGSALIRHNALQAMNPASAMKLLTTYAALEQLGPAHTWKTDAYSDTPDSNGRIAGNLYLRGSGDPRLALEQFWLLLRQLRQSGLREIGGDLVLDRSAFKLPPHDPAEFDNQPLRPYNTGPDALLINLKSVRLSLRPEHHAVTVLLETPAEGLEVDNQIKLSGEACGDWRERISVSAGAGWLRLRGSFPAACGTKTLNLSPWSANRQTEALFRALWREIGGRLGGKVREGLAPQDATPFLTHESPPLAEVVREINKFSNNVMARQVFLSLDPERPATPEGARRQIEAWLSGKGLNLSDLVIDNGSGLSRRERISADGLTRLLLAAWESPVMPELISSLPLAGVDGTLKKRLDNGSLSGRAHLKTGYLENVRSIAGYVLDLRGRRWIVVFLINDANARAGKPAMDALLEWLNGRG